MESLKVSDTEDTHSTEPQNENTLNSTGTQTSFKSFLSERRQQVKFERITLPKLKITRESILVPKIIKVKDSAEIHGTNSFSRVSFGQPKNQRVNLPTQMPSHSDQNSFRNHVLSKNAAKLKNNGQDKKKVDFMVVGKNALRTKNKTRIYNRKKYIYE